MLTRKKANDLLLKSQANISLTEAGIDAAMLAFPSHTSKSAQDCNIARLKECMTLLQDFYTYGDPELKFSVEHVYMPALTSSITRQCTGAKVLRNFMPVSIYPLYVTQRFRKDECFK
jgi:hypothetical protein